MNRRIHFVALAGLLLAVAIPSPGLADGGHQHFSAGQPGDPKKPFRVVEVTMHEGDGKMGYSPENLTVKCTREIAFYILNEIRSEERRFEFLIVCIRSDPTDIAL